MGSWRCPWHRDCCSARRYKSACCVEGVGIQRQSATTPVGARLARSLGDPRVERDPYPRQRAGRDRRLTAPPTHLRQPIGTGTPVTQCVDAGIRETCAHCGPSVRSCIRRFSTGGAACSGDPGDVIASGSLFLSRRRYPRGLRNRATRSDRRSANADAWGSLPLVVGIGGASRRHAVACVIVVGLDTTGSPSLCLRAR